jgi:hypothetical protein
MPSEIGGEALKSAVFFALTTMQLGELSLLCRASTLSFAAFGRDALRE